MNPDTQENTADFLVIGSGIAGLTFALKAAAHGSVIIVSKDALNESNTVYAQGGIAAALGNWDDPEKHLKDTLEAGAGLCDPEAVRILVNEGVDRVRELISMGISFTRNKKGKLHLGREGGHTVHRIVHTHDHTGKEVGEFLIREVLRSDSVRVLEYHTAIDLITEYHLGNKIAGSCYGAYVLNNETGDVSTIRAHNVLLATGGGGQIYRFTTNPRIATGDGVAMAYRAGCRVRNLEFFQFHPTALYADITPSFLISEALRGFGAGLRLQSGEEFMHKHHTNGELAPRDIVARAIDAELKARGDDFVLLDISHERKSRIKKHFPHIYNTLKKRFGIRMNKEPVPVVPAAHYMCGGVMVNYDGGTDLAGLYAIGECASTGVHGGNRLASNSLLEGLVFADRALRHILNSGIRRRDLPSFPDWDKEGTTDPEEWILVKHDREEIQKIMWDLVGIVRTRLRLERALRRIELIYREVKLFYRRATLTREVLELRNLALLAQLTVRSALSRKESRGLHYCSDYPENRDPSRQDTILAPAIFRQRFPDGA